MNDGLASLEQYKANIKDLYMKFVDKQLKWKTEMPGKKVQYFRAGNYYKLEALLDCPVKRLFRLCADRHYTTRSQWDSQAFSLCQLQQEHYKTEDGDIYLLDNNIIFWLREPTVVMYWPIMCIWIKSVDKKAFMTVISSEKITMEPELYENVARDSFRFLGIYNTWKCETCYKMVPPHELYCRGCKKERYVRCADLACYEPQMKDATKCWKCKQPLNSI